MSSNESTNRNGERRVFASAAQAMSPHRVDAPSRHLDPSRAEDAWLIASAFAGPLLDRRAAR